MTELKAATQGFCFYWVPKRGPRGGEVKDEWVPCILYNETIAGWEGEIAGRLVRSCTEHKPLLEKGVLPNEQVG